MAFLEDRQVSNAFLRHKAHDVPDLVIWTSRGDVRRHALAHAYVSQPSAVNIASFQDVTLCNDADHPVTVPDNERSTITANEFRDHLGERCLRADRKYFATLYSQNVM